MPLMLHFLQESPHVRPSRDIRSFFCLLILSALVVVIPLGCGGGAANDASKYPPGQSPEDEDIRKQMLKGEEELKKVPKPK
jgi:hypothetical protein